VFRLHKEDKKIPMYKVINYPVDYPGNYAGGQVTEEKMQALQEENKWYTVVESDIKTEEKPVETPKIEEKKVEAPKIEMTKPVEKPVEKPATPKPEAKEEKKIEMDIKTTDDK